MAADLQLTIDSDDELPTYDDTPIAGTRPKKRKRGPSTKEDVLVDSAAPKRGEGDTFNSSFAFDGLGGVSGTGRRQDAWDLTQSLDLFKRKNEAPKVSVEEIIARRKVNAERPVVLAKGSDASSETLKDAQIDEDSDDELDDELDAEAGLELGSDDELDEEDEVGEDGLDGEDDEEELSGDVDLGFDALRTLDDEGDILESDEDSASEGERVEKPSKRKSYFASPPPETSKAVQQAPFSSLPNARLSRPVLLGLSSLGLSVPTPIQAATIPVVLLGKDVVGSSVTGSGKTVAFWVGVIERLLYRDKRSAKTRVVCICPTRELAVQVFNVGKALARYTDISFCLCVGGLSLKAQEAELKRYPDIVVSTPGRLIDHVRNTQCFTLDSLEILIIDEADRILEEGFRDELTEIVSSCPHSRSTLLFSATITEDVKELARLSLDKPVRIKIDTLGASSRTLSQEFLRVRDDRSVAKEAVLVTICRHTFRGKTIVFFRSKAAAHRVQILFALAGLRAAELHGDLSQEQRLQALDRFRNSDVDYLLATDLASRGLDIKGVENVINFEMPVSVDVYLHRVGRTARAGSSGRALTLVGEADRRMVKLAVKHADPETVKQVVAPSEMVRETTKELAALEEEIAAVMEEEKEEKALRRTEMDLKKGENLLEHAAEIKARPARTWFQTANEKKEAKSTGTAAHNANFDAEPSNKRPRKEKLNHKQRRRQEALSEGKTSKGAVDAAVRSAKKASRPTKISSAAAPSAPSSAKKPNKKKAKAAGGFGVDLGDRRGAKKAAAATAAAKPKVRSSASKKASGKKGAGAAKRPSKGKAPAKVKAKSAAKGKGKGRH